MSKIEIFKHIIKCVLRGLIQCVSHVLCINKDNNIPFIINITRPETTNFNVLVNKVKNWSRPFYRVELSENIYGPTFYLHKHCDF